MILHALNIEHHDLEEVARMKKGMYVVAIVVAMAMAGTVAADSLTVNAGAAMGGTNFGLEVTHDNSSPAYVQDNTPDGETVYRFDFLFNVASMTGQSINFRQEIIRAIGSNPNPGVGNCPVNPADLIGTIRVWLYQTGGGGQNPSIQLWAKGNWCGERGSLRIPINYNTDYRICVEWKEGAAALDNAGVAVVDAGNACPTSGDPAWQYMTATLNSIGNDVGIVRMGTPSNNSFGAGESGVLYFDEFASYRTLTP
jgi:hypothetical protein